MNPGSYDIEARRLREELEADCVSLIVAGGKKGPGFSVVGPQALVAGLPAVLRQIADQIDAQMKEKVGSPQ